MIDTEVLDALLEGGSATDAGSRLFTCLIAGGMEGPVAHAFRALVAGSPATVRSRLAKEYGAAVARRARVAHGVDRSDPGVRALLLRRTIAFLETVRSRAGELAERGFDMTIEQRFH